MDNVTIRLEPDTIAEIDREAAQENRTRSQMIRVLLSEGLAARRSHAVMTPQQWAQYAEAHPQGNASAQPRHWPAETDPRLTDHVSCELCGDPWPCRPYLVANRPTPTAVQVEAAKLRVITDRKLGIETQDWVREVAGHDTSKGSA